MNHVRERAFSPLANQRVLRARDNRREAIQGRRFPPHRSRTKLVPTARAQTEGILLPLRTARYATPGRNRRVIELAGVSRRKTQRRLPAEQPPRISHRSGTKLVPTVDTNPRTNHATPGRNPPSVTHRRLRTDGVGINSRRAGSGFRL